MNIVVFSQNVILESIVKKFEFIREDKVIFLTTHKLYENERKYLQQVFYNCEYIMFADLMTDEDGAQIDHDANVPSAKKLGEYINNVKHLKNVFVLKKVHEIYGNVCGFVCCDDLGIEKKVWLEGGFKEAQCKYYYSPTSQKVSSKNILKKTKNVLKKISVLRKLNDYIRKYRVIRDNIFETTYDGRKYVFIGNLNRIGYRMNVNWRRSNKDGRDILKKKYKTDNTTYLSTIHELPKALMVGIEDASDFDFRILQDGYLPPNDPCEYLYYYPKGTKYYAWDILGSELFKRYDLAVDLLPFRKKIFLPDVVFKNTIKKVLVVMSGPGDWTAIKNRSDEDLLVEAIVFLAKKHPDINFVIRCHPTWTRPECNGTNSINRCAEYIKYTGLSNITVSSNIPIDKGENCFKRSSLEADLQDTDFVFGEHSIGMIDGVMKNIPFSSTNLTNRRNLFVGITKLGFPHCETINEMDDVLSSYNTSDFQKAFNLAIKRYNEMTDQEL